MPEPHSGETDPCELLRQQMETQIQRLKSLATTARAVTTLGSLGDVLRVICTQAQELLNAAQASINLPIAGEAAVTCVMATGSEADRIIGMRIPTDVSLNGRVLRTGRGICVADLPAEPVGYPPAVAARTMRSTLFQPLQHRGMILGVLVVGHPVPGYFDQDDLDYLARYAEYAAVAVANAQLHTALHETAEANARLYREAEGMRSYLNTLIHTSPDIMLTIRRDLTIHVLNPDQIGRLGGYRLAEVEGQPFLRFIAEHLHTGLLQSWQRVLAGQPQSGEIEILAPDGTTITALLSAALIPEYGEVFVIVKDVTEQRALEAQIRQHEKLAALGRMVAGVAHELNNPLAVILGLAQLQSPVELAPAVWSDIEAIEQAARRARSIVQQLMTFARPEQPLPQLVYLKAPIDGALNRLAGELAAAGIRVTVALDPARTAVSGDPYQLEQLFFNILHNAVQALDSTPPGSLRELLIEERPTTNGIHLTISDSGPGIAPQHLSRIFDPFFTLRPVGQGAGLGLAIVHTIVQQHGGRIWVRSQPGRGTTFELDLPIARLTAPEPPASVQSIERPASTRILVVEDEASVRALVARMLGLAQYTVDAVGTGEEALERALAQDYALILSDLQMPGIDGPALFRRLHTRCPTLRWLILTGDTMSEQSRTFLEQTGLPVLAKPFTREQLLKRVAECLR